MIDRRVKLKEVIFDGISQERKRMIKTFHKWNIPPDTGNTEYIFYIFQG